jgi:hypothetical protein
MAFQNPVAVYNASSNVEAQLLRSLLAEAGIEAFAIDDVSQAGAWVFGLLPEIHKPQVWVDRENVERAKIFIEDYDRHSGPEASNPQSPAYCYSCGEAVEPGVPACPACGNALDWSDDPEDVAS